MVILAQIAGGCSVQINGVPINPNNLNDWLAENSGYNKNDGSIELKSIEKFGLTQITTTDLNVVKQRMKYTSESAIQTQTGDWYSLRSYTSSNLQVQDSRGQITIVPNSDFKMASVYTNRKCGRPFVLGAALSPMEENMYVE